MQNTTLNKSLTADKKETEVKSRSRSGRGNADDAKTQVPTLNSNVFVEIGLPNADVQLLKAEISMRIEELIEAAGLTQEQAACRMGITQPDVSEIVRGTVRGYTLDRLVNCLLAMGQNIEVSIPRNRAVEAQGCVVVTH